MNTSRSSLLLPPSPPLLLLLLLLRSALSVSGSDRDVNCPAIQTIGKEEQSEIKTREEKSGPNITLETYMYPESGFRGISLEAVVNRSNYTAWFPLQNTSCFPDDSVDWWKVLANALVQLDKKSHRLTFQLNIGKCNTRCAQTIQSRNLSSLHIVAHGPSGWRQETLAEENCKTWEPMGTLQVSLCTASAIDTEDKTASTELSSMEVAVPAAAGLVAMLVLGAVLGAVVLKRNRQGRVTTGEGVVMRRSLGKMEAAEDNSEMVVIKNSVYEATSPSRTSNFPSHRTNKGEQ
ncbi:uncharacterized protein LOC127002070 [Eriocheir sinensis]|uniref:uncharacterized protein LOC127002070 n=1 Tax=Eriocheir sinensis TaxID=95602 RepID=UPI0021C99C09|nr:uncharacterized protein LOC127002070 [Eriocheir sinensis]